MSYVRRQRDGKRTMLKRFNTWLESRIDVFAPFDDRETPPASLARFAVFYLRPVRGWLFVVFLSALLLAGDRGLASDPRRAVRRPPQQRRRRTSFSPTNGSLFLAGSRRCSSWCGRCCTFPRGHRQPARGAADHEPDPLAHASLHARPLARAISRATSPAASPTGSRRSGRRFATWRSKRSTSSSSSSSTRSSRSARSPR